MIPSTPAHNSEEEEDDDENDAEGSIIDSSSSDSDSNSSAEDSDDEQERVFAAFDEHGTTLVPWEQLDVTRVPREQTARVCYLAYVVVRCEHDLFDNQDRQRTSSREIPQRVHKLLYEYWLSRRAQVEAEVGTLLWKATLRTRAAAGLRLKRNQTLRSTFSWLPTTEAACLSGDPFLHTLSVAQLMDSIGALGRVVHYHNFHTEMQRYASLLLDRTATLSALTRNTTPHNVATHQTDAVFDHMELCTLRADARAWHANERFFRTTEIAFRHLLTRLRLHTEWPSHHRVHITRSTPTELRRVTSGVVRAIKSGAFRDDLSRFMDEFLYEMHLLPGEREHVLLHRPWIEPTAHAILSENRRADHMRIIDLATTGMHEDVVFEARAGVQSRETAEAEERERRQSRDAYHKLPNLTEETLDILVGASKQPHQMGAPTLNESSAWIQQMLQQPTPLVEITYAALLLATMEQLFRRKCNGSRFVGRFALTRHRSESQYAVATRARWPLLVQTSSAFFHLAVDNRLFVFEDQEGALVAWLRCAFQAELPVGNAALGSVCRIVWGDETLHDEGNDDESVMGENGVAGNRNRNQDVILRA